ncbi:hypothetical protein CERSUDRAFT_97631 [Gelatoporia subvermispora B]|uniref:Uncharacterized protein n=1 Tax=Ceriporiopsis subvermispora (strain B) TaxID=914234 RepID=M2QQC3_CERS8|nr:hypothetical protein CERSUDRAFT_97631 [Gelatoporia subvermispora B]
MHARLVLLFVTLLAFIVLAAGAPTPEPEAAAIKRALKQFDARHPKKRDDDKYKPSKIYWYAADPTPPVGKRDDVFTWSVISLIADMR